MRTRLFLIIGLALASVLGVSTAAHAGPKGPGTIGQSPTTTTPPQQPKDKLAPTPTTQPPKGPGDIAPAPKDDGPKGPDDLAPAPKDNKPKGPGDLADAPKGGGVEPGPDTTGNGSGSDNFVPSDSSDGNGAATGEAADTEVAGETVDAAAKASHDEADSSRIPAFLFIFFALLVAALIGFVAMRFRSEDEDVPRV
ncbi:MAG: hypothetical protein QOF21_680 [Actinomycetota bacterium]|jgi:hypothetical protein